MKKTPLRRKKGFRKSPRPTLKRSKLSSKRSKVKSRLQVPKWFKAIKLGSHGNTPTQKRYWKLISDHVRQEDFEKYGGKCVSCSAVLERWQDGDCAHWRAWSLCNSYFKFERKNLALSCKGCNRASDGTIGYHFGEELKRRWGNDILDWIVTENEKYRGQKLEDLKLVDIASKFYEKGYR